jgi:hypothetical protein
MLEMIDKVPYLPLLLIGGLLLLAPFTPEPHLFEKLKMLKAGNLTKPVDIFDLLYHSSPLFLLGVKVVRDSLLKS